MTKRALLACCGLLVAMWLQMTSFAAGPYSDLTALRAAAERGDPWAQLNLGAAHDHGQLGLAVDPAKAVRWYRAAADQGLAPAQFNLAHCLATGHGVARDDVRARHWMARAAAQALVDAQYLFGVMLAEGIGGPVAVGAGRDWLTRAADAGHEPAQSYLKQLSDNESGS